MWGVPVSLPHSVNCWPKYHSPHLTYPLRSLLCIRPLCGFRNMNCFTGKGYWSFAQPPTWRARCCSSSDLSPGTCLARLNLPGTAIPADIASRVTKARKPPHHNKMGRFAVNFNCKKLRFSYTISLFVRSKYPISGINVLYAVLRYLFYLNIPFTEIS